MTTPADFRRQIASLTAQIAGRPLDADLDAWLNREHGAGSPTYAALKASCEAGVADGWLCRPRRRRHPATAASSSRPTTCTASRSTSSTCRTSPARTTAIRTARSTCHAARRHAPLRRPPGRLARLPPGSAHRPTVTRRPRAGAVPAAAGQIEFTRMSPDRHASRDRSSRARSTATSSPTPRPSASISRSTCWSATPTRAARPPSSTTTARSPTASSPSACAAWPARCAALGVRREERVLLLMHDGIDWPVALPRRDLRRHRAGGGQHAADRRRLRLHARALRAQAALVSGALLPTLQRRRWRKSTTSCSTVDRLARRSRRAAPTAQVDVRRASSRAQRRWPSRAATGADDPALLALLVGLDRPAQGHGAHARQPVLDRRAVRQRACSACARTTSASRPPSCSSPTAWATR